MGNLYIFLVLLIICTINGTQATSFTDILHVEKWSKIWLENKSAIKAKAQSW